MFAALACGVWLGVQRPGEGGASKSGAERHTVGGHPGAALHRAGRAVRWEAGRRIRAAELLLDALPEGEAS